MMLYGNVINCKVCVKNNTQCRDKKPSSWSLSRPRGYKTFFMLNTTEHENYEQTKSLAFMI